MNKNLKAGLIVSGVVVGLLAVAFVANAAGLIPYFPGMPYRQQMMQGAYGGWGGGMMGGWGGGMMGGGRGHMTNFADMPHHNWTTSDGQTPWENCPYYNEAQ